MPRAPRTKSEATKGLTDQDIAGRVTRLVTRIRNGNTNDAAAQMVEALVCAIKGWDSLPELEE